MSRRTIAILLALFLGGFGIQKFYLNQAGFGILSIIFFWTFLPLLIAFVDIIRFLTMTDAEFDYKYPPYGIQKTADEGR